MILYFRNGEREIPSAEAMRPAGWYCSEKVTQRYSKNLGWALAAGFCLGILIGLSMRLLP